MLFRSVMLLLCIAAVVLGSNLQKRPSRRQVLVEKGVTMLLMQHHSLAFQNVRRNDLSIVTEFLVLKDLSAANAASPATAG